MIDVAAIGKSVWPTIKQAREMSVFVAQGRVFLNAAATAVGCMVDGESNIVDGTGAEVTARHPDYEWIITNAKIQAVVESKIGREILDG